MDEYPIHSCIREESRQARKIITETIYPLLGRDSHPSGVLPEGCPINASLDMFLDQEEHKTKLTGSKNIFQCQYCGKRFRTEFYMDRHMDNKHADKLGLPGGSNSKCLGDLCGILGCGMHEYKACIHDDGVTRTGACTWCDPTEMDKKRHQCTATFRRCFNPERANEHDRQKTERLRDRVLFQFCNHLGCDSSGRRLPPPSNGAIRSRFGSDVNYGKSFDSFRIFSCVVLAVVLSIFYMLWGEMMGSIHMRDDLTRFTRLRARRAWLAGWKKRVKVPASEGASSNTIRRSDGAEPLFLGESKGLLKRRNRKTSARGTLGQSEF